MDKKRRISDIIRIDRAGAAILSIVFVAAIDRSVRAADPIGHVRAIDSTAGALITDGSRGSRLFRSLRERLDRSDVFVYVEHRMLPSALTGRLTLLGAARSWRYLRIEIECRQPRLAQIAALGHELQHAVEIADAGAAVDPPSIQKLYGLIGFARDAGRREFETDAAREAGSRIRRELLNPRAGY
jgi:hypothetical protein